MLLQLYDSEYGEAAKVELSAMSSSSLSIDLRDKRFSSAMGVRRTIESENIVPRQTFVICHGLSLRHLRFLRQSSTWAGIWWIGLGWDYYPLLARTYSRLLRPITRRNVMKTVFLTLTSGRNPILRLGDLTSLLWPFAMHSQLYRAEIMKLLNGCYFSPGLSLEYKQLPDAVRSQFNYLPWTYGVSLDHALREDLWSKYRDMDSVVLGNSGTLEGNHFDVIHWLELSQHRVSLTIPIERGDPGVIGLIQREATNRLGNHSVKFLRKKISREKFLLHLSTHEFYVAGHLRQQGAGTLKMAITAGCTPVMDYDNPLAQDMLMRGFKIVSLNAFKESLTEVGGPRVLALKAEDKARNVRLMKQNFSQNALETTNSKETFLLIQDQVRKISNE